MLEQPRRVGARLVDMYLDSALCVRGRGKGAVVGVEAPQRARRRCRLAPTQALGGGLRGRRWPSGGG